MLRLSNKTMSCEKLFNFGAFVKHILKLFIYSIVAKDEKCLGYVEIFENIYRFRNESAEI
jgi:hypothetical protein